MQMVTSPGLKLFILFKNFSLSKPWSPSFPFTVEAC